MNTANITLFASLMLASAFAFADCPDGGRDTTASERADYVDTTTALKTSLPAAPAGWRILDRYTGTITAPNSTCKGSMLVPGYYVTYIWTEQEQRVRKVEDDKSNGSLLYSCSLPKNKSRWTTSADRREHLSVRPSLQFEPILMKRLNCASKKSHSSCKSGRFARTT